MQQLISKVVIVCGIIIYLLNGLRVKRILRYNKWKMRIFKKEAKPRAFRLNLITLSTFGLIVIIFCILIVNYYK